VVELMPTITKRRTCPAPGPPDPSPRANCNRGAHMAHWPGRWPSNQQLTEGAIAQHLAEGGGLAPGRAPWIDLREQPAEGWHSRLPRGRWAGVHGSGAGPTSFFGFTKPSCCSWVAPPLRCSRAMRAKTRQVRGQQARGFHGIQADGSTRGFPGVAQLAASRPSVRRLLVEGLGGA